MKKYMGLRVAKTLKPSKNTKRKKILTKVVLILIAFTIFEMWKDIFDEMSHHSIQLKSLASAESEGNITNSLGMEFTYIKPGTFMMGSSSDESNRRDDETKHRVTLSQGFYMQTTEVTQGQWKAVMGSNPSYFKECGDECPVEKVSWYEIKAFIQRISLKEGTNKYRLPTEAQWEYACRAGTTTRFNWGDNADCNKTNYGNGRWVRECDGINPRKTMKVASFPPNAWGLYDMHGNVWEWCQDRKGLYPSHSCTNPEGPIRGSGRVVRGGSWDDDSSFCRSAVRHYGGLGAKANSLGFRLIMIP